jgi:hypothetical protein
MRYATFFDVKVSLTEKSKMRESKERIEQVEHGAFNALVFTTAGGQPCDQASGGTDQ